MLETKVFTSGHSQAVRIPKEYQTKETELFIQRVGSAYVLTPRHDPWALLKEGLEAFTPDFMADGRCQPPMQERAGL